MPLRIPTNSQTGYKVKLTEYVCKCDNEFYVSCQPHEAMLCPFCGGTAFPNGDIDVIIKADKKKIPEINIDE